MNRLRRASALRLWIVAFYALATVALGLSHHASANAATAVTNLAAYALPDGSLPLLCLDGSDGADGGTLDASRICGACLLTAAPGLPNVDAPVVASLPPAARGHVAASHEAAPPSIAGTLERSRAPPITNA